MKVRFTDPASADVRSIIRFYTHERRALGIGFFEALNQATFLITENPRLGSPFGNGYRRVTLRRFPYSMIYIIDTEAETIRIVSVSHQRRRPSRWKGRVEESAAVYQALQSAA